VSSGTEGCAVYVALVLAAYAAVATASGSVKEAAQKLHFFMVTSTASDVAVASDTIGDAQVSSVSLESFQD
jgi:hypothetical protein